MAEALQVRVSPHGVIVSRSAEPRHDGSAQVWRDGLDCYRDEDVADWTPLVDVTGLIGQWEHAAAERRATSQHGQAKAYDECILNLRQLLEVDW